MSKDTIYCFLKKNRDWYTCKELAKQVRTNLSSANRCLRKLRKEGVIISKRDLFGIGNRAYYYKIR